MADQKIRRDRAIKCAEDELNKIDYKWSIIKSEKYNPVTIALQMLDTSSLGKSHQDFHRYHSNLSKTLEGIAEEYYEGFNNSIHTFSGLYDKLSSASLSVKKTKASLIKAKKMLMEPREDLNQLYLKSKQLSELVTLLNRIEEINKLPLEIKKNVENKQFLVAVSQLVEAIQFLFDPELRPIEALSGLRQLMEREKDDVTQVIIEELHNHIYLKSPYCVQGLDFLESKTELARRMTDKFKKNERANKRERRGSISNPKNDINFESNDSPESDSFAYIDLLMESLLVLNRVDNAIDAINDRVRWELSHVVDIVISEVEYRGKVSEMAAVGAINDEIPRTSLRDQMIFQDFIRTLYLKFMTIINYHDHLIEVIKNLKNRERYSFNPKKLQDTKPKTITSYNKNLLWAAMIHEILMILTYYLIPSGKDQNDVLEQTKLNSNKSSHSKLLFIVRENKDVKNKSEEIFKKVFENYKASRDTSFNSRRSAIENTIAVDHYATDSASHRHKALVNPSIELAPILFSSTAQFISEATLASEYNISDNSKEINISKGNEESTGFLKRFYTQVFTPEAEAQINSIFYKALASSDIFQPLYSYHSENERPIFRSASILAPLIRSHELLHSSLGFEVFGDRWGSLVEIIEKYYERILTKYHDILTTSEAKKATCAEWAKDERLAELLARQFSNRIKTQYKDSVDIHNLQKQTDFEIEVINSLKLERSLFYDELIFDCKKLVFLAQLRQSLKYVYDKVTDIQELQLESLPRNIRNPTDTRSKIKQSLNYYRNLSNECLILLRVEIITHIIYYLDLATREGDYYIYDDEESKTSPDQYILALNADLNSLYEKLSTYLFDFELTFLFDGVSFIMAHYLIAGSKYIKSFNAMGCKKMYKNIVCLQQNLTNISFTPENGLSSATMYYSLYENEINESKSGYILKHISENGVLYTFQEYKRILDLVFQEKANKNSSNNPSVERDQMKDYSIFMSKLRVLVPELEVYEPPGTKKPINTHASNSRINSSNGNLHAENGLKQAVSFSDIGLSSLSLKPNNIFGQGLFK
ncbi:hypothetical protein BB561_002061 [Smittium simulii]|uniref:Exocyst complex component Sec8 n=1 Tax=Smittium simulii TaxID=133385 RepID=A0A2T9YS50_9FUNG|nr:hypothetical protein BB561_002061 [Smittium simulii]